MRHSRSVLASAAVVLVSLLTPATALAIEPSPSPMQQLVDDVIEEHGGVQTGWNEVTWDEGDIMLTIDPQLGERSVSARVDAAPAAAAKDNCAAGKYCAYAAAFYGGSKLTYSACPATYTSFSVIGAVRSIKNSRTSGTVRAYNGSTVKSTMSAGQGSSNISGITKITCS
ncbi:MAG: peptidase inhibitor family I36 protein [Microbacterium sp.]